jgi:hypothetical protein
VPFDAKKCIDFRLHADGSTALRYTQVSTYGYTGLVSDRRATGLLTGPTAVTAVQKVPDSTRGRGPDFLNQFIFVFLSRCGHGRLTQLTAPPPSVSSLSSSRQCSTSERNPKSSADTSGPERVLGV